MKRSSRVVVAALLIVLSGAALAQSVLVTALQGNVSVEAAGLGKAALEPFVRLREGDRLILADNGRVSLVYVAKARQETWRGAGTVVVGESESRPTAGKPQLQVRSIPPEAARQMNKTPVMMADGRVGMMRMRNIPPHDAVTRLENEYKRMRSEVNAGEAGDILPEVFLLAGLYDLRQYTRIEEELKRIAASFPQDETARSLQTLYAKAIESARKPAAVPDAEAK